MRVVIVGEDRAAAAAVGERLVEAGKAWERVIVASPREWEDALADGDIDALVLDLRLGWADWSALLAAWRAARAQVPAVLLAGPAAEVAVDRGLALGASDYAVPPDWRRLRLAVQRSVDLKQAENALSAARAGLERRVAERTAALSLANAALRGEIAERRRAEETLAALAARLQEQADLLNLAHDAIIVRDLDGVIRFWNQGAARQYGWTAADAAGQVAQTLLGTEFPEPIEEIYAELLANGHWEGELRHTNRAGRRLPVASRWVLQRDGQGHAQAVLQIDHNISGRRQAEERAAHDAERLGILHEIDQAILSAQSARAIAQAAVRRIRSVVHCQRVRVVLFDFEEGVARVSAFDADDALDQAALAPGALAQGALTQGYAGTFSLDAYRMLPELRQGDLAVIHDLAASGELNPAERSLAAGGIRAGLAVALRAEGQLIGALDLWSSQPGDFPAAVLDVARPAADSLAVAIHNASLFEQVQASRQRLQELSRGLVEAQERERQAIARELHDEAGQSLTALMIGLGLVEKESRTAAPDLIPRIEELKGIAEGVLEGLHRLSRNLRPASLDRLGLVPALRQHITYFQQQTGVNVEFIPVRFGDERLSPEVETTLYRVVQEALTNVARHASASRVGVVLKRKARRALVIVEDDGKGFDIGEAAEGGRLGLVGMRERVEMLGGRFNIESGAGKGTTVFADVPI